LIWLVWRWGLMNYLPRMASNRNPPSLSLLNSSRVPSITWVPFPWPGDV
jgi:hypothetical protein